MKEYRSGMKRHYNVKIRITKETIPYLKMIDILLGILKDMGMLEVDRSCPICHQWYGIEEELEEAIE